MSEKHIVSGTATDAEILASDNAVIRENHRRKISCDDYYPGKGVFFSPPELAKLLLKEEWEVDVEDEDTEVRRLWVGTLFRVTPSGKMYTCFATSNLDICERCKGHGDVDLPLKRRTLKKREARLQRELRLARKRLRDIPTPWTESVPQRVKASRKWRKSPKAQVRCPMCGGVGSREAYQDQLWQEYTEKVADEVGRILNDSAYFMWEDESLFLCMSRPRETEEDIEAQLSEIVDEIIAEEKGHE